MCVCCDRALLQKRPIKERSLLNVSYIMYYDMCVCCDRSLLQKRCRSSNCCLCSNCVLCVTYSCTHVCDIFIHAGSIKYSSRDAEYTLPQHLEVVSATAPSLSHTHTHGAHLCAILLPSRWYASFSGSSPPSEGGCERSRFRVEGLGIRTYVRTHANPMQFLVVSLSLAHSFSLTFSPSRTHIHTHTYTHTHTHTHAHIHTHTRTCTHSQSGVLVMRAFVQRISPAHTQHKTAMSTLW